QPAARGRVRTSPGVRCEAEVSTITSSCALHPLTDFPFSHLWPCFRIGADKRRWRLIPCLHGRREATECYLHGAPTDSCEETVSYPAKSPGLRYRTRARVTDARPSTVDVGNAVDANLNDSREGEPACMAVGVGS